MRFLSSRINKSSIQLVERFVLEYGGREDLSSFAILGFADCYERIANVLKCAAGFFYVPA